MSTFSRLVRSLRPTILVVLGALIGAGVAPVMAGVHPDAQVASVQTRTFSCPGLAFVPQTTDQHFFANGLLRSAEDSGYAICNAVLPTHARVTQVQFTLLDSSGKHQMRFCALVRLNLQTSDPESYVNMAEVPATGVADAPGYIRQTDTSINSPTIDNAKYSYYLQCKFELDPGAGVYDRLGILGGDVVYTISPANG